MCGVGCVGGLVVYFLGRFLVVGLVGFVFGGFVVWWLVVWGCWGKLRPKGRGRGPLSVGFSVL